jgi:hypothetical protein
MSRPPPRFTREFISAHGTKLTVAITPEAPTSVVLSEAILGYAATLDPRTAQKLGSALSQAAGLAAINALPETA